MYDQVLLTHKELTREDRMWLINHFNIVDDKALHTILAYKLSITGQIAQSYNSKLDKAAKQRNESDLMKLYAMNFQKAVPEIASVPIQHREILMNKMNLEYSAIKNVMNHSIYHEKLVPYDTNDIGKTPYCKSFELLCIQKYQTYLPSITLDKIYLRGKYREGVCYNRNELYLNFLRHDYTNPITNEPFEPHEIEVILSILGLSS